MQKNSDNDSDSSYQQNNDENSESNLEDDHFAHINSFSKKRSKVKSKSKQKVSKRKSNLLFQDFSCSSSEKSSLSKGSISESNCSIEKSDNSSY